MCQQQRDGKGLDVITETQTYDVAYAEDGRVPGSNVPCAHTIIHNQMKDSMNFWQVGMLGQVEISCVQFGP